MKSSAGLFQLILVLLVTSLFSPGSTWGAAKQGAKKSADGEEAEAQVVPAKLPPLVIERPAEVGEKSLSGRYSFYLGGIHGHSIYSGDLAKGVATKMNHGVANYQIQIPAEVFQKAATNFYDFSRVAGYGFEHCLLRFIFE